MSSEDFKQALREGKLSEALLLAISKAPEIEITTWIASPGADEQSKIDNSLHTTINLVAGEINNVVGEGIISGSHPEIERLHFQEVERARDTIRENLATVQQILRSLAAFQQQPSGLVREETSTESPPSKETSDKLEPAIASQNTVTFPAEDTLEAFAPTQSEFEVENDSITWQESDETESDTPIESSSEDEDWGDWLEEDSTPEANRDRTDESSDDWQ